jgi:predicted CoA-binding protein
MSVFALQRLPDVSTFRGVEQHRNPPADALRELLRSVRRVAVVGLSPKPYRLSNQIAASMQRRGYEIIPVHPCGKKILGVNAITDIAHLEGPIDMVNVFRRSEFTPDIARHAVRLGVRAVWLQHGIEHPECAAIAKEGGVICVMNACWAVTYSMVM